MAYIGMNVGAGDIDAVFSFSRCKKKKRSETTGLHENFKAEVLLSLK